MKSFLLPLLLSRVFSQTPCPLKNGGNSKTCNCLNNEITDCVIDQNCTTLQINQFTASQFSTKFQINHFNCRGSIAIEIVDIDISNFGGLAGQLKSLANRYSSLVLQKLLKLNAQSLEQLINSLPNADISVKNSLDKKSASLDLKKLIENQKGSIELIGLSNKLSSSGTIEIKAIKKLRIAQTQFTKNELKVVKTDATESIFEWDIFEFLPQFFESIQSRNWTIILKGGYQNFMPKETFFNCNPVSLEMFSFLNIGNEGEYIE